MRKRAGGRPHLSEETRLARVALGERLQRARENAELTQCHLADVLGVHARRISEWEAGERGIYADSLIVFARTCGVTVAHLLGEQKQVLTSAA